MGRAVPALGGRAEGRGSHYGEEGPRTEEDAGRKGGSC